MKKIFSMIVLCLTLGMTTMMAQNKNEGHRDRNETPEQRINKQAMRMVDALSLDDKTGERFITTYKTFKNDIFEVMKKYPRPERTPKAEGEKSRKTDAEIEKEIKDQFAMSREILDVRERYYNEFRKFLNPRQIKKMYGMEREGMKKLGRPHGPFKAGKPNQRGKQWQGRPGWYNQRPHRPAQNQTNTPTNGQK